jgi:hypothetical protein
MRLNIAPNELHPFSYIVREEVRLGCTHVSDCAARGTLADEDGLAELFDRLALFSRWAADLERGLTTGFEIASSELESCRYVLRDLLVAEAEWIPLTEQEGDVVNVVEAKCRVDLVDSLAAQIGGLF